ncbi:hypothetical protein PTKU64_30670 [Paraburkholderia terrae]|uniref:Methyltransferase domain-containing protein n=1 Tax=Paraburkholderia terrae TaxID=311230 RepID=A0ABM7TLK2_9BURK|nr:hypothetical protein [Paraburkholderia terrae]BCZ79392.1 hypothetical protein PTKU64_30670 [Paraburkholderia terrae]
MNTSFLPQIQPAHSLLEQLSAPSLVQKVAVSRVLAGYEPTAALTSMCQGKRVLHVGCATSDGFDPADNLHMSLLRSGVCAKLTGVDEDSQALDRLSAHCDQPLLPDLADVSGPVDIVLVPQMLERIGNVAVFLTQIDRLEFTNIILSVTDASQLASTRFDFVERDEMFVEIASAQQTQWFTPFTLQNAIRRYTSWRIKGLFYFDKGSLLMIASKATAESDPS